MLKSGRKRSRRHEEMKRRMMEAENKLKLMDMLAKNKDSILLNVKKGYLYINKISRKMYILKYNLSSTEDLRLPNSTILNVESVDEDRHEVVIKDLGKYSIHGLLENFKIVEKIKKRIIKFEE